ncbi:MAG TPA: MATE family efflux transporter [Stellaceae bacterium]|nr:MATE family efflux transporter [Stellaceae bacterium]
MTDLTEGSITRHLLGMAAFIGVGLICQTLYFVIDLYFVSRLGKDAVAGVSAAGFVSFLALATSQIIAVGGLSLIARATGAKDQVQANLVSNQALGLSILAFAATLLLGYVAIMPLLGVFAADDVTGRLGRAYLAAFLPSMAMMFPTAALGAALRATGVVQPTMLVQTGSVLLNALLAPVLVAGWGTGIPLGVGGAGLASSIAAAFGLVAMAAVFPRAQAFLRIDRSALQPRFDIWGRIVAIGLPSAGEFFLMFTIVGVIYWVLRRFGPEAQAGFGIGSRVMQSIFLPAMAISFAVAPVAGQNFGARRADRVRSTFFLAAAYSCGIMAGLTLLCQWSPAVLVGPFTDDAAVASVATTYLGVQSWNFVATGLAFTCSAMFQALGNTTPALLSSAGRLLTFALPALYMASRPDLALVDLWHLSVASIAVQALCSVLLLRYELSRKLAPAALAPVPQPP